MVQQSLSIFLAFYGIGMLVFGPLADAIGRRPLALGGLAIFFLASLLLSQAQSIEWFLTWRALQAFAGSAPGAMDDPMVGWSEKMGQAAFELIEDRGADYSRLAVNPLIMDAGWNGGSLLAKPNTVAPSPPGPVCRPAGSCVRSAACSPAAA